METEFFHARAGRFFHAVKYGIRYAALGRQRERGASDTEPNGWVNPLFRAGALNA